MGKNPKNLPAEQEEHLPANTIDPLLEAQLDQDMGKGVSTDAADNLVPLIYVLQPLSPQVMDGPSHIEGARPGDIWLKNAADHAIIKGKEGMYFMPCHMYQKWTEWIPRQQGGGFIGSYDYNGGKLPEGAMRDTEEKKRPKYIFPDTGHDCVDTRYEAGIVWIDGQSYPYVIPFKSTGHAVSKAWMTKRTSLLRRGKNGAIVGIWPSWSHIYKLTTSTRTNNQGTWYQFDIGSPIFYIPGMQDKPAIEGLKIVGGDAMRAYEMGKALAMAFQSGAKVEAPEDAASDDAAGPDYQPGNEKPIDDNIPY